MPIERARILLIVVGVYVAIGVVFALYFVTKGVGRCDPAAKGNSATSRTKPATLSTGLSIQVPEYLKQGEFVKVDTRTGEYMSRAKN